MELVRYLKSLVIWYKLGQSKYSMARTLPPNVRFLVLPDEERTVYEKGDVIVFRDLRPSKNHIVKKVIGLPNEDVSCDGKDYFLGPDEYFVLGDSENLSPDNIPYDSRYFGPVPKSHIIGKAWLKYWPLRQFGFIP